MPQSPHRTAALATSRAATPARQPGRCAALLAGLAALAGCGGPERPDVVLVVVDTLRADKLGCLGSPRGLTPAIDRFAEGALVFEQASAHAPWTLPSIASLFTSTTPPQHGAGGRLNEALQSDFRALPEGAVTLAEALAGAGFRTALIGNVSFLTAPFGLTQGFEHCDVVAAESNELARDAHGTTEAALAWLRQSEGPSFLVVHYFDPHAVYDPPAEFRERFAAPEDRSGTFTFGTRAELAALRRGQLELDLATLARAERLYDGEIAFVDRELGRLLAFLEERSASRPCVVALTADHGEEFGDHAGFEHGHTLYRELLHVPLLVSAPGLAAGRVRAPVAQIDLAPTLCELAGVALPSAFAGQSLAGALTSEPLAAQRGILAEGNMWGAERTSWRSGNWKLVRSTGAPSELYDLARDPLEQSDLAERDWRELERMQDELFAVVQALAVQAGERAELDAETRAVLERLGYVLGAEPGAAGARE